MKGVAGVVRLGVWGVVAWSFVVFLLCAQATAWGLDRVDYAGIFYYLFLHHEFVGWLVLALCTIASWGSAWRALPGFDTLFGSLARRILPLACAMLPLLWLGTHLIYHDYPFAMDEFCSAFQAKIFLRGQMTAEIPEIWRPYSGALTPLFISLDTSTFSWISAYLPVYSALHALFLAVGAPAALNPLLGAASMILIADCARKLWPQEPQAAFVAAILLVTSTQFLATSISYYSMPAHLCANLGWLWLYLRNTRLTLAIAPWLGGLAVGLHQPVVHALFVLPFCIEIVWRRRWALAAYFVAIYAGFLLLWYWWHGLAIVLDSTEHALTLFRVPDRHMLLTQAMNATLLFSWQSAAFGLCLVAALASFRHFSAPLLSLALGVAATGLFYCFYFSDQGHGWGYRYAYGVLGNAILLAVFGWLRLAQCLGRARANQLLATSTLLALCVQSPLRMFEVEQTIRPFAHARDYFSTIKQDIVVVDHRLIWYGQDLVRNDPTLAHRPVMLNARSLSMPMLKSLTKLGSVKLVAPRDLLALGMIGDSLLVETVAGGQATAN